MITLDQMRTILASDEPTDMWLLHEDGSVTAQAETPSAPLDEYLRPDTFPRYICRSQAVDNLVAAMGEERALRAINMQLTVTTPQTRTKRLAAGIAETLKGLT